MKKKIKTFVIYWLTRIIDTLIEIDGVQEKDLFAGCISYQNKYNTKKQKDEN